MIVLRYVLSTVFIGVALLFYFGKGLNLIKTWRDTPEETKNRINKKALERNAGTVFLVAGIIIALSAILPQFQGKWFHYSMLAWFVGTGFDLYYLSKSKKFNP